MNASSVLLLLRTIAFWQGNKYVFYGLLVYGVVGIPRINYKLRKSDRGNLAIICCWYYNQCHIESTYLRG